MHPTQVRFQSPTGHSQNTSQCLHPSHKIPGPVSGLTTSTLWISISTTFLEHHPQLTFHLVAPAAFLAGLAEPTVDCFPCQPGNPDDNLALTSIIFNNPTAVAS